MNPNTNQIRSRIITDIILFFTVLYAPWWFLALFIVFGIGYFKNFYEAFFAAVLFEVLFSTSTAFTHGFRFFFSLASLLAIFSAEFLKGKLRM